MRRLRVADFAGLAAAVVVLSGCGGNSGSTGTTPSGPSSPCASQPLPVVSSVVVAPGDIGLESVTEFSITAQGILVYGYGNIIYDFGDGTTASASNVAGTHTVTHVYTTSRSFTTRASVSDSCGRTGSAFAYGIVVSNMAGSWTGVDATGRTRSFALKQSGAQLTGEYTSPGETAGAAVSGRLAAPKGITLDVSGGVPPVIPFRITGTVSGDVRSFAGVAVGGSAGGSTLTFTKQ